MRKSKVTDEDLIAAVASSKNMMEVLRKVGIKIAGGSHSHYSRRVNNLGLDTSHFLGKSSNKGIPKSTRKTAQEILVKRESGLRAKSQHLVRALIEVGRKHECEECGLGPVWNGHPLTLEVDHINEDWLDDREENLRFLCPNCHSQFTRGLRGGG